MGRVRAPALAEGVYAALLTPRKPRTTDADAATLLDYLDRVVTAGVDGILLFGSTGEFIHFDIPERTRAATLAVRRSRAPVLVNISHSTMSGAIALAESALNVGAAGLLLMPPYFYHYSDDDICAFYRKMCDVLEGEIPLYVDHLPQFTGRLAFKVLELLLGLPGVAGIVDGSDDLQLLEQLRALQTRLDFRLMVGDRTISAQPMRDRPAGVVSAIAAVVPELLVCLHRAKQAGNTGRSSVLNGRLIAFLEWADRLSAVLAIHETAAFRGWVKNELIVPLSPQTQDRIEEFRGWLAGWLPVTLLECGTGNAGRKSS